MEMSFFIEAKLHVQAMVGGYGYDLTERGGVAQRVIETHFVKYLC